ncbi:MAG: hypothetical protein JO006_09185 [Paucibacter sp.]|nr:hypothetical protein [Roseateles sp.]
MSYLRERLPDPVHYFEDQGLILKGRGKWRTTSCNFHNGSDSMRISIETGGWVCMSCGKKGGDVLAYHMAAHGLEFVDSAKALGAWVEDGPATGERPRGFSARDALSVIAFEIGVCVVVISDARRGVVPNDNDWQRFLIAAGRVQFIAAEVMR